MSRTTHPEKNGRPQAVRADYYGLNRKHHRKDHWRDICKTDDSERLLKWINKFEISWDHDRPRAKKQRTLDLAFIEGIDEANVGQLEDAYIDYLNNQIDEMSRVIMAYNRGFQRNQIATETDQAWAIRAHEQLIKTSGESLVTLIVAGYLTDSELRMVEEDMMWDCREMATPSAHPVKDDWMDPVTDERTGEFVDWENLIQLIEDYSSEF